MMGERQEANAKKLYSVWVCPKCGKTAHIDRSYCDCHAGLTHAKVRITEDPPDVDRCNFESNGLTCADCPETCKWCASFGVGITNSEGFGGRDCLYYSPSSVRCCCCQAQVKLAVEIGKIHFGELMGKMNAENFYKMANFIGEQMKAPVLARINAQELRAG
jgi:hypothetical protein